MPRPVRNLTDMEIDEISTVDKTANQHSRFVIAKRAPEEDEMPRLYNQEGQPLDENDLDFGDIVYDDEGNAYEYVEDDDSEVPEDEYEDELEPVGKAGGELVHTAFPVAAKAAKRGRKALYGAAGAAGLTAAGAGGAVAHNRMKKSFTEEVMDELSKSFSDSDRDQVIAKALGRVEELEAAQHQAEQIAKSERDLRLTREYISKAAEYNLPVAPEELGPVLYRMAESMSYDDCAVIAKCLETAGEIIFQEVGYTGGGDNADVYSQVQQHAYDTFGKSENFNETTAINKVFEDNPDAYDEYLAAQRNR